jgi:aldose 1-epimerase
MTTTRDPIGDVGRLIPLRHGRHEAVATDLGAGLREYTVDRRAVLDGCPDEEPCTAGRGHVLIPWPNRVAGASYTFDGVEHRLNVTEPKTGAANHGLTRRRQWEVVEQSPDRVVFAYHLAPAPGYPFQLRCEVHYQLDDAGLRSRIAATNTGDKACPYAAGAHPYLTAGTTMIDELTVQVPATQYYVTDERGTPLSREPVDGTPYDLRTPTQLGDRRIDHAFTGLTHDTDGRVRVRLQAPDGTTVTLWGDAACDYLQLYTGDKLPEPERRRRGLAVEPMTAAPNAFNSGDGLRVLQPDETAVLEWGIETSTPRS